MTEKTDDDQRRRQFLDLMEKYVRLGALLPDELDREDAVALAETQMILDEKGMVKSQIDTIIGGGQ